MAAKRKKIVTIIIDVILHIVVFFLGLGSYCIWDSGVTSGASKGTAIGALFALIGLGLGFLIVMVVLVASLFLRKTHWYIVTVTLAMTLILGFLVGVIQDLIFITPAEYGERGAIWASGRYGSWRVLK